MQTEHRIEPGLRFKDTINGFNEEFSRILLDKLDTAFATGNLFEEAPVGDNYPASLNPGFRTAAEYLAEQMHLVSPTTLGEIKMLLLEARIFLEMLK